nr:PAS domain-containing protein [uncultured Actinoplanes sp.]
MSRAIEWFLLGAGSCGALILGVIRNRPARIGPWLLLAVALAISTAGDVLHALQYMAIADVCYVAMFFPIAAALLQFTRGGTLLVDRARLIDLLACTCSTLLVVWVFVVGDKIGLGGVSPAYVIGCGLLVGVAARLHLAAGRNLAATLLLAGSVATLVSNIIYPLSARPWAEAGYVVLYLTWGLAALHPSMVRLTEPMPPRITAWRRHWVAALGLSVATPPAVLLIEAVTGEVDDGMVIALACGVTVTLAITRLRDAASLSARALARERALRAASADLVSAADLPSVDEAVRAAVAELVAPKTVDRVIFATDDRQLTLEALPPAPSGPRPRSWWVDDERPSAESAVPWWRALFTLRLSRHPSAPAADQPATLVCPLWLEPLAVARPSGGALVLTGRRDVLTMARDALEVLAGQAALALDRITLVDAVGRRDSDLYLRAVIRNTPELMLVIDEDRRIRYASPAVHELLGATDLSPLATLEDLVHDDDRSQVRGAFTAEGDGTLFFALRCADQSQALVEATYRDLRDDRLVQGFVVTMRNVTTAHDPVEQIPRPAHVDELPAWVNRRSAQHKFRY